MKIPFGKLWQILEREDYANYLFVSITWEYYTWLPKRWGFMPGRFMGAEYVNTACNLFQEKSGFDLMNKKHFQMLFTNPLAWDRLHRMTEKNSRKLFALGRAVKKLNPHSLSNKQLVLWISKFQEAQAAVHDPRGPMFILETPNNLITNYLVGYLREKYKAANKPILHPNEAFQALTTGLRPSILASERGELAKISLVKNKDRQENALLDHAKKYEWLEYGLQGRILTFDDFKKDMRKMDRTVAKALVFHAKTAVDKTRKLQLQLFADYNIHPVHRKIFKIVQDSFYTRAFSKDSQFFGYYSMEPLFREVGHRAALTLEQVKFLHYFEFEDAIFRRRDFSKLTTERQKYSLFVCDSGRTVSFCGAAAKKIRKKMKFFKPKLKVKAAEELKGQPAFKGIARGRVKIINTVQEMAKMHAGNILVSHMTNPGIVPAMKQAAAIVTDLGGITCHAAIVARELKKPCIIGTKFATQVLMDGDEVEVDADKGIVRKV
ncbi:MAG: PEP-utilizing enzyme [bacterium]|nr:PEP-utilizing enzyme [bacterium]